MNILQLIRTILITCLLLPFVTNTAIAGSELTLNQLYCIAIENNKELKAAKYNIAIAEARLIQAGQWSNPSLNLANTDDQLFNHEGEYTRSIGFSQQFPVAGRIGRQKEVARVDVAIALAEIKDAERKLKGDVALRFYTLLLTHRHLQELDNILKVNQKLTKATRDRFRAAEVSELDVNTAQLEYQRLLQEKNVLERKLITETAELNKLLGRPPALPLYLNKTLPKIVPPPDLTKMQMIALQQRPDFQAAVLSFDRSKAEEALAHAERWEDWIIGVGVEQSLIVVTGAPPQSSDRALSVNVTIPLPLLKTNRGRILEANATGLQALAKLQALELSLQVEVANYHTEVQALQSVLHQLQKNALPLGEQNINLTQQAYNKGQISLLEVVQIQRQQNDLRLTYLNTLGQYLESLVKLQTAIGNDFYISLSPPQLKEK